MSEGVKLVKVVVDRNKWIRGHGSLTSFLLVPPVGHPMAERWEVEEFSVGKMCCMGFAAHAIGFTLEEIFGMRALGGQVITGPNILEGGMAKLPGYSSVNHTQYYHALTDLYTANDSPNYMIGYDREEDIKSLGLKIGLDFEFIN